MKKMELIQGLDIHPFTKIYWKRRNDRLLSLVTRASHIYHEAEYETVKRRLRKCSTHHITPDGFEDEIERITSDGLFWIPIARSKHYEGFSHKHFHTHRADPERTVYGTLSWKLDHAKQFKEASNNGCNHIKIAGLLGYPDCCAKFFAKVWKQGYYDPIWQAAENTEGAKREGNTIQLSTNGYANESMRYFGLRIVPQLTCNFKCKESEKQGKIFLEVMRELDNEAADFLFEHLKEEMTWSVLHGIGQVETEDFVGITNSMPTGERFTVKLHKE